MTNHQNDVERMAGLLSGSLAEFASCIEKLTVAMQSLRFALNGEDKTITVSYIAQRINRLEEKCDAAFDMIRDGRRLSDIEASISHNSDRLDMLSKKFTKVRELFNGSAGFTSKQNPGGPENTTQGNT